MDVRGRSLDIQFLIANILPHMKNNHVLENIYFILWYILWIFLLLSYRST